MSLQVQKLKLLGFNNLTKTLSFNIYDICYAATQKHKDEYLEYIDEVYNSKRLTQILTEVCAIIGASILNIATQDYEPRGASVTLLIAEDDEIQEGGPTTGEAPGPVPQIVVAHLDKSHVTVHTYPETHPDSGISTFRVDIDVSTCGRVSPLKALNCLIHSFDSDIVIMDYRVRGFTRDILGGKHFIDHDISSIQNFISKDVLARYQTLDVNVYQDNLFHTKMILKQFDIDNYLFGQGKDDFLEKDLCDIEHRLRREMDEIFSGRNLPT